MKENKFVNSKFVERWTALFSVIFSPGFFLGSFMAIFALLLSVYYKVNVPFSNTMAIIGSIFGGIAGAFFKDEYDRITNKNILEKKGRSALRNLEGIKTQLRNIEMWVLGFGERSHGKENKNVLEEINRHISTIGLNISAGLKDWEDIIPELKEMNEKNAVIEKKYKEATLSVMSEILEKRKELAAVKNEKDSKELKEKIEDLEKQIKEIKKDRAIVSNGNILMGSSLIGGSVTSPSLLNLNNTVAISGKCISCGKLLSGMGISYGLASDYCDECKEKLTVGVGSINPKVEISS